MYNNNSYHKSKILLTVFWIVSILPLTSTQQVLFPVFVDSSMFSIYYGYQRQHNISVIWEGHVFRLIVHYVLFSHCKLQKQHRSTRTQLILFLLIRKWADLLVCITWSVCISKSLRILCISSSRTDSCLWINRFSV